MPFEALIIGKLQRQVIIMTHYEEVYLWTNGLYEYLDEFRASHYELYFSIKCKTCGNVFSRARRGIKDRKIRCPKCYKPKCESYLRQLDRELFRQEELKKIKTCVICGDEFKNGDERRKTCSSRCAKILKNSNHGLKRFRHKGGQIIDYGITLQRIYDRDNGKCWICGEQTDFNDVLYSKTGYKYCGLKHPVKDHIIPLSYGGDESWENIRLACWKCNRDKSDAIVNILETEKGKKLVVSERCGKKDGSLPVAQYTLDGKLVKIYMSAMQAERETGIAHCQISAAKTGRQKTAHGYIWKPYTA